MNTTLRVGHGFDAHPFAPHRRLVLGGITIPHTMGLQAHSDGDIVIHALMDALLGAAALGDIGQHFPDTDPPWKDADSRNLLRQITTLLTQQGYSICNVDITIIAQIPKLANYYAQMRACLAIDMQLAVEQISIKATTTNRLGFVGRKEGIAANAVVLIQ